MQKFRALGRLKIGVMNKTEIAYSHHLEARKHAGEVVWYKFEAMKFRLADNTTYEPDFAVLLANGELQFHEVKGAWAIFQDDAKVKIKVAADLFPMTFIAVVPKPKKDGGGWEIKEY